MSRALIVRLKRSVIGRPPKHRRIVKSLGLKRLQQQVHLKDTPAIRGMISKVAYLLEVEESADETSRAITT